MSGTAYHNEALRKARRLERNAEARKKLEQKALGQSCGNEEYRPEQQQVPMVFAEPGHYAASSKHRINHRRCRAENEGEDKVMPLLHPTEYNFRVPIHELPPRKPHFKV